ncbi:MAG: lytic transglycosylase domain-containing protein [Alphaproteobacteria bacterium]|nr:lytic transglycosylase domain-containing protein [Alphaproteobacteria bacterium]
MPALPVAPRRPRLPGRSLLLRGGLLLGAWASGAQAVDLPTAASEPDVAEPAPEAEGMLGPARALQGAHWALPPPALPGSTPRPERLEDVAALLAVGRTEAALAAADHLAHTLRDAEERAAAWLAAGMVHREAGRANLASEAFTQVRFGGGPLAPLGAWFEAEQDLARGRAAVAVRECRAYLDRWPEGWHAEDCEVLLPFALADAGDADAALEAADAWDAHHAELRIGEPVRLAVAAWARTHDPARAVALYQALATRFEAPRTPRVAEAALAALRREGQVGATVPDDLQSLTQRATSLRLCGRGEDAWALYTQLQDRADDTPWLGRWVEGEATSFAWSARRYDLLAGHYRARAAEDPDDARALWLLYRALDRGGHLQEAGRVGLDGLARFSRERPWRREEERIARTLLLAQDHVAARRIFDELGDARGWAGVRNRYYAAFASLRLGDTADALRRLDALVDGDDGLHAEARYWRATLLEPTDPAGAARDRAWITGREPTSWYGLLLADAVPAARTGRWPGAAAPRPDPATPVQLGRLAAGPMDRPSGRPPDGRLAALSWSALPRIDVPAPAPLPAAAPAERPFDHVVPSSQHDPGAAAATLHAVACDHGADFPLLLAVELLARVGLHELSGPMLAAVHDDWGTRARRRDPAARALAARLEKADWIDLFVTARDDHDATRFAWGLHRHVPAAEAQAVQALALPIAHGRHVWRSARRHDVDPLLVLGLMRTESQYDPYAVSRVGARGPMQIMPRTGNLLADLRGDETFHVGMLHDPELALELGVQYLGLLMERFDGVFPLAVAAYNAGPHNVSAWLDALGHDVPLDVLVEYVPFGETRRYVRSVTERYAEYVALYGPTRAGVELPPRPRGDHPEIVDF